MTDYATIGRKKLLEIDGDAGFPASLNSILATREVATSLKEEG